MAGCTIHLLVVKLYTIHLMTIYCITTNVMRTCTANRTWDGQTPSASEGTLDQGIYGPKILVFKNKTVVFLQLLMRRCLSHSLHKCGWELDSFLVELCLQLQF